MLEIAPEVVRPVRRAGSAIVWREAVIGAGAISLVVRAAVSVWAFVVVSITPGHARTDPLTFFSRWGSSYFASIATEGYFGPHSAGKLQALFPAYPILARLLASVLFTTDRPTESDISVGLWLAAAIPSLIAAIVIWMLAAERFGPRIGAAATALFVAGPYGVVLAASCSESLYLALALLAWYQASRGRWVYAGLLGAAASLTRIDGLFLALALGVLFVNRRGIAWRAEVSRAIGLVSRAVSGVFA
ncbi:MAG: hypothetical protein JWP75_1113 [Frondihabitans sp.]|nr:hypothetical protein [Frondihabitans sp.]